MRESTQRGQRTLRLALLDGRVRGHRRDWLDFDLVIMFCRPPGRDPIPVRWVVDGMVVSRGVVAKDVGEAPAGAPTMDELEHTALQDALSREEAALGGRNT